MKFLVDAQLPRRIATWLRDQGHDPLHTLDLPDGNRTADASIMALSSREHRIVVTKEADFVDSFILRHQPEKLLLISTGNITNAALEALLRSNLATITAAFDVADFVELNRSGVVVHG
jgi:predicted nuclease of predicted toxin-antitoxin system